MKKKILSFGFAIILATATFCSSTIMSEATESVIELNSGAARDGSFVSVNEGITTIDGDRQIIMTGLKDGNKDLMVQAVENNFSTEGTNSLKVVDNALPDAEKYNAGGQVWESQDTFLCWAASASNMLWISGWAEKVTNPSTGSAFTSEDDIFQYFTDKFTNEGSDAEKGIEWFFTGEYFMSGDLPSSILKNPDDPQDGLMKTFVSTNIQTKYNLIKTPDAISELEKFDQNSESPAVFEINLGIPISSGLYVVSHAVTPVGLIIDPSATDIENRYKAIALLDSDNDGEPSEEASKIDDPTTEQKMADKEARTNSVTFYPIKYQTDDSGCHYWEVVDYSPGEVYVIRDLNKLSIPNDDLINKNTETEGSCSAVDTVDFTLDTAATTANEKDYSAIYSYDPDEDLCTEFKNDQPIYLVYYVTNRSGVDADSKSLGKEDIETSWVVKNSDGKIIAQGTDISEPPINKRTEAGRLVKLNENNGSLTKWEPGEYTVTVNINPRHNIKEAYFLNNKEMVLTFNVTGDSPTPKPSPTPEPAPTPGEDTTEATTEATTEQSETEVPTEAPTEAPTTEAPTTNNKTPESPDNSQTKTKAVNTGDIDLELILIIISISFIGGLMGIIKTLKKR